MKILEELESLLLKKNEIIHDIKHEVDLNRHIISMLLITIILCAIYGICIGIYKIQYQIIFVPIKLPILFLGSFIICFPTLYVFNALLGVNLKVKQTIVIFLMMISMISIVVASFSFINAFMLFTVTNYDIIRILNVLFFIIAGISGAVYLLNTIEIITGEATNVEEIEREGIICSECGEEVFQNDKFCGSCGINFEAEGKKLKSKILPRRKRISSKRILSVWLILYGFVIMQMAWLLRPYFGDRFEGTPPFLRPISQYGNVFSGIIDLLKRLFG